MKRSCEEAFEAVVFTENDGLEGEEGGGSGGVVPLYLGSFDSPVDLFDERFHQRTGNRQALAAVSGIDIRERLLVR